MAASPALTSWPTLAQLLFAFQCQHLARRAAMFALYDLFRVCSHNAKIALSHYRRLVLRFPFSADGAGGTRGRLRCRRCDEGAKERKPNYGRRISGNCIPSNAEESRPDGGGA